MISKIGHVGIEVKEIAKARPFYDALAAGLGLRVIFESEYAVGYGGRDYQLRLGVAEGRRVERQPPNGNEEVIADHLAILVSSKEDVDKVAKAMEEHGIRPLFPPEECPQFTPNYYAASFCDPGNYVIEVYTA